MREQRVINHLMRAYSFALKRRSAYLHERWTRMSDDRALLYAIAWANKTSDRELMYARNIGPRTVGAIRALGSSPNQ